MGKKLIDSFNRHITYLRVSIIESCNYKCSYCRPEDDTGGPLRKEYMTNDEFIRAIRLFTELGVRKIRLTGGEPLLRKNIIDLVSGISCVPNISDLSMSTNAHLLERFAKDLKKYSVNRVNISLDSLDKNKFRAITRGGDLTKVLAGIDAVKDVGMNPIKINMVVINRVNDSEIEKILDFAIEKNLQLRFIELMPIGEAGIEAQLNYYSSEKILDRVKKRLNKELIPQESLPTAGPARIYKVANTNASVGVISAISNNFCSSCNRVRLTAKGTLVLCLGQDNSNISIRDLLRDKASDDEIKQIIINTIVKKPEKHEFNTSLYNVKNRRMVSIGG